MAALRFNVGAGHPDGDKVEFGTASRRAVLVAFARDDGSLPTGANASGELPIALNSAAAIALAPRTTGGHSAAKVIAAGTITGVVVKASAGQVYGISLHNAAATAVFIKFFNKATAPVAGTDTPVWGVRIPAGGRADMDWAAGIAFATGIGYVITTDVADNGVTSAAANDLYGQIAFT